MAETKKDVLKGFKLSPEKSAKQKLKMARWKSLAENDIIVNFTSTNRVIDVMDAENLGLSEEETKALMTKKAREEFESITQE